MRNYLLTISFVVLYVANANVARCQLDRTFSLFKFGFSINTLSGDIPGDEQARLRFHLGVSPTIFITDKLYLKPELAYSLKGGKVDYDDDFTNFDGNIVYRLNYLELPILLGFKANNIGVELGGYAALKARTNFVYNGSFLIGLVELDNDAIEEFDYGLAGGVAFFTPKTKITLRYYHGLIEIASNQDAQQYLNNATLRTIQVSFQRTRKREK